MCLWHLAEIHSHLAAVVLAFCPAAVAQQHAQLAAGAGVRVADAAGMQLAACQEVVLG